MRARWSILLLLLALPLAQAAFTASFNPDTRTIKLNDTARFTLTLTHDSTQSQTFEIYSPEIAWDITTEPTTDRVVTIYPQQARNITLILRPLYVTTGYYVVPIHIRRSGANELGKLYALVGVLDPDTPVGIYLPTVKITTDIPASLDPRSPITLPITLENKNRRDLERVTLKIRSALFNKDIDTSLASLERKDIDVELELDPRTPPQEDVIKITALITADNRNYHYDAAPAIITIPEHGEIAADVQLTSGVLKRLQQITFTNTGNARKTQTYSIDRKLWGLFTNTEPEPRVLVQDGITRYAWDLDLEPGEQTTLLIVTNYRILAYLAILAILGVIAYYVFRSPVIIAKTATIVATHEGGITELKVMITVVNRSKHDVKDVVILDKVPRIASVVKDFDLGTVRPVKMLHDDKKGTLLKWKLDVLDSREERVIAYKMRSSLTILGGLQLPVAVAKCQSNGHERTTRSNVSQIGFGG